MNMKKMATAIALPLLLTLSAGYASAAGNDCSAKRTEIENQIAQAKAHNNANRVAGLETALSQLNANCTTEGLVENAQDKVAKLQEKIAEKQADITKIEAEQQEARAKGDQKKVAKYDKKIAEKKSDIADLEVELSTAKKELDGLKG
ncbi:DUF1090 domain-containing protein [Budvicia aquatica]|nr:DUF1090 domain-containing protein [Budvicia aquatica]GKX50209.1 hypothetical protein SOASR029_05180 [Budvicia aquatica]VFS47868.1 Protein of uncharacterised function (DUF1090) [Budvicia aquatica]